MDRHGDGGAVSEGMLRERDLLAILFVFPLRDLIARLVFFTNVVSIFLNTLLESRFDINLK